jgi:hypothetical protein
MNQGPAINNKVKSANSQNRPVSGDAKVSCQTAVQNPDHRFADISKTIAMPRGAE